MGGGSQRGMYVGVGVQFRLSFFSLLYGTPANISRKPATRGMASQHLRTFERMDILKTLTNERITLKKMKCRLHSVATSNLFLFLLRFLHSMLVFRPLSCYPEILHRNWLNSGGFMRISGEL